MPTFYGVYCKNLDRPDEDWGHFMFGPGRWNASSMACLPLPVEPNQPLLCQDARFLNLWMSETPFTLDQVTQIPRYVPKDTYQTVLDDKSGYDHLLLDKPNRTYFGFQWGGWYLLYNSIPLGWKISPFIYQSTGLEVTHFLRCIGIPGCLYIGDRHNG